MTAHGIDLKRTLAITNFYFSESDRELNLARAVRGLRAGLASLDG